MRMLWQEIYVERKSLMKVNYKLRVVYNKSIGSEQRKLSEQMRYTTSMAMVGFDSDLHKVSNDKNIHDIDGAENETYENGFHGKLGWLTVSSW